MQGKLDQSSAMALSGTHYGSRMSDYSDASDSDDSQDDPTFDILDETRSNFSSLSVQRKPKSRIGSEKDGDIEEEPSVVQMVVPELDEKDKKDYDIVQKAIEDGCIQSLKLDQCKIYLRKHGLRLTGTKDILIRRIKEHLEIVNGCGEKKYPPSSFVVNCQGDACTGDVVLFEQNVYEMFSIVSRSASGPPSGTRMIAGRIVKESYGAAKQQHTFTIEVLWSRGEKPLPPLHPLLIKGRNLYRLRTMRQKWEDEGERQRILAEKHSRGCVARSKREVRVQQKELRNTLKSKRVVEPKPSRDLLPISSINMENQFQKQREQMQDSNSQKQCFIEMPKLSLTRNMPFDRLHVQRQPFTSMNNVLMGPWGMPSYEHYIKPKQHSTSSGQPVFGNVGAGNHNRSDSVTKELCSVPLRFAYQEGINNENVMKSSFQGHIGSSVQQHFYPGNPNMNPPYLVDRAPGPRPENNRKPCRYYAQGRCHYGQKCKYLHSSSHY